MKNLIIISRDWKTYKARFESNDFLSQHFSLIHAGFKPSKLALDKAEVMISEPDLAAESLRSCPRIEWLQSTWAGNNKLQNLNKQDYQLTGVKGVFGLQMVEYVLSYILYFTRRIEEFNDLKNTQTWSQLSCKTLSHYKVGIMGLGSIGQEVAQKLLSFGISVNGFSRSKKNIVNITEFTYGELTEFLNDCDFVVNFLPETEATTAMCDKHFFAQMKNNSVFINAGRGSAVKSPQILIEALETKKLKAAVIDVFEQEPLPQDHAYYQTKNLYLTCHTAAISDPNQVFDLFERNANLFIQGKALQYQHDFTKGY